VFKKDEYEEKRSALKKVDGPSNDNGNVLTWKNKNGNQSYNAVKEIKRRDPNQASNTDDSDKIVKRKVLSMHEPSEDNGLIRKKK